MTRFDAFEVEALNARFRGAAPEAILAFALETFPGTLAFACSFGLEDVLLVDLLDGLGTRPRAFFLDTGRLPQETYDTAARIRARYRLPIATFFPNHEAVQAYVDAHGPNAFFESLELRRACCHLRKVEPLQRALAGAEAWITGLRREQAPTRANLGPFELDWTHRGILKINPLVDWELEQVRAYLRVHDVPTNPLHERGYPSLGCAPCTRAVAPGEDQRAGRWWWEAPEHKECGLHAGVGRQASGVGPRSPGIAPSSPSSPKPHE
ncbi:MAG TPA: phosphoadenylyl-sulfate reductase [Holophagaceae bacterium]|nr:phosphoadenylyl-sulfate reductase [Holophagaceae bacterium]